MLLNFLFDFIRERNVLISFTLHSEINLSVLNNIILMQNNVVVITDELTLDFPVQSASSNLYF